MSETLFYEQHFKQEDKNIPYAGTMEYAADLFTALDFHIRIVTMEKEQYSPEEILSQRSKIYAHIQCRQNSNSEENRLERLIRILELTNFETFCMVMAFAGEVSRAHGTIFAQLQNHPDYQYPTKELAIYLYQAVYFMETDGLEDFSLEYFIIDSGNLGKYCLNTSNNTKRNTDTLILDENIQSYLLYENISFIPKMEEAVFYEAKDKLPPLLSHKYILEQVKYLLEKQTDNLLIQFYGNEGVGKHFLIKKILEEQGVHSTGNIIFYQAEGLSHMSREERNKKLCILKAYAVLSSAAVCLELKEIPKESAAIAALKDSLNYMLTMEKMCFTKKIYSMNKIEFPEEMQSMEQFITPFFFITEEETESLLTDCRNVIKYELSMPEANEKAALWREFGKQFPIDSTIDVRACANQYILTPVGIQNVLHTAMLHVSAHNRNQISQEDISFALKQRQQKQLGSYATHINTVFTWKDLILEEKQRNLLRLICNQMKYRDVVGEEWGFYEKMPYGRGISTLFYGAPGTGKTMAAQVLANELGLSLYRIDLSQMVSKYIGETEKNISQLFKRAQNINAILFFDEADALFAKRSEVKDSNDRSANSMTAHLLQKLEDYDGITVLATNLIHNMDDAFKRRIKYIVQFTFPNEEARLNLFRSIFPSKAVCSEKPDFEFFAEHFELSGSSIKEVLLNAAYFAAGEGSGIRNRHIVEAVKLNYLKYGKMLTDRDFGYLV